MNVGPGLVQDTGNVDDSDSEISIGKNWYRIE